jgi:hypothetical protein
VSKELLTFQSFDDAGNPVVAAHAQVVALCNIVGEHNTRVLTNTAQHRQKHVALQRLSLVHDDEGIVE